MSNYTKSTNFATKDNLTPGDPLKVVRGTEIDTEFNNISTAIATKTDNSAAAITGGAIDGATVGATTPATGAFTTLAASGTTTLAGALVGAATQSAFNTVSTTLNLGGAATALNLGAATGTATVNNTTLAAKAITASTTLAVTGTSTLTGAVTATAGVSGPITSSSVSITGGSITGITDLAVADGGTGASTAAGGLNNLLPSQTGNASKYLQTDGTNASWDAVSLSTADITGTLGAANGGTGVSNNAAMTVTGSGNFAYTRTLTGTTNVTFPTTGTLATLAGTETLTNKTLTSPTLTTPTLGVATGTSFQGIIGNVTPAAGSFTTLGASSTATLNTLSSSGATLTGGTINGMTVGATTPSSGAFTTVTASTAIGTASGGTGLGGATPFTSGGVVYASSTSALATGSALTFDGTKLNATALSFSYNTSYYNQDNQISNYSASNYLYVSGNSGATSGLYLQGAGNQKQAIILDGNASGGNIAFQTNAIEALRLTPTSLYTASGINVGIGLSNPSSLYAGANNLVVGGGSGATGMTIYSGTSDVGRLFFADGTSGADAYRGWVEYGHTGNEMTFGTNGGTKLTITSAGNLGLGIAPSGSNLPTIESEYGLISGKDEVNIIQSAYYNSGFKYSKAEAAGRYLMNSGIHSWHTAASGTAGDAISFTQAMTLDANGTLIVGSTSPIATSQSTRGQVSINGSSDSIVAFGVANSYKAYAYTSSTEFNIGTVPGIPITFTTNSVERARIDSSGYFRAKANGGSYFAGGYHEFVNNNNVSGDNFFVIGNPAGTATNNTSSKYLICADSGADRLYIYGNGNVVNLNNSYGALSDVKLKENIVDATPKLANLMQVKVRNYNLIGETTKQIGVVAQELETVFPAMIDESPDRDREGNDLGTTTKSVKYSVFVPMLIKAMQEQQAIIESLKARLDAANL